MSIEELKLKAEHEINSDNEAEFIKVYKVALRDLERAEKDFEFYKKRTAEMTLENYKSYYSPAIGPQYLMSGLSTYNKQ